MISLKIFRVSICFSLFIFFNSCGLQQTKSLKENSKKEMDAVVKELKLEQFKYSFYSNETNGKSLKSFDIELWNVDDSIDFEVYNNRIIKIFEDSEFELKNQDFIFIAYYKSYIPADLWVYYKIDPNTKEILKSGN